MGKIYHVAYKGYVNLYTPVEAESIEDALTKAEQLPGEPTKELKLSLYSGDFDFYIDEELYLHEDLKFMKVSKELEAPIVASALEQGTIRAARVKQNKLDSIQKQIDDANNQLLTVTKGITSQIESLTELLKSTQAEV